MRLPPMRRWKIGAIRHAPATKPTKSRRWDKSGRLPHQASTSGPDQGSTTLATANPRYPKRASHKSCRRGPGHHDCDRDPGPQSAAAEHHGGDRHAGRWIEEGRASQEPKDSQDSTAPVANARNTARRRSHRISVEFAARPYHQCGCAQLSVIQRVFSAGPLDEFTDVK